ncbi:MAG: T9SS type A sorting domain-containing protein [Saprospiraceae bacterium]|nr:T9SS type A sorting domain-containing protein [Saprospiraceae bacterium]
MKRNFIFFAFLFSCSMLWAGTPTIDGTFDGTGVWGAARATSDLTPGWGGANAKKLYVTADANYIYLGAEISSASWQHFAFLINTKAGGGSADSWGRKIVYDHANKPDYVFRGHLGRDNVPNGNDYGNYAEFHSWDGASWTGVGTPISNNGTTYSVADNIPNNFNAADGFVEVRIARTAVTGASQAELLDVVALDVQFLIYGDGNNHGPFDAVPDDNNATDWDLTNPVVVSNYAPTVAIGVTWLDFLAKAQKDGSVDLTWSTASEKFNSHFDVQRSANGRDWTTIGTVKGNGTTNTKKTYQFTDNDPLSGINYYRLKQVDFDDKFEYSTIASVDMRLGKKALTVFPNPASDKINFVSNNLDTEGSVQIFDMKGSLVRTVQVVGNQLDISDLAIGLYQVRFINKVGVATDLVRFVKQ